MRRPRLGELATAIAIALTIAAPGAGAADEKQRADDAVERHAVASVERGRRIFRFDTFGDQAFWGGALRLHEALAGVSPRDALALGLRVDADALPRSLQRALRRGQVDLDAPATTLALLRLDAVIGVKGFFGARGTLESVGIQCALCHSTVDDSLASGIGRRRDGWANRDLDVGAIIALAPNVAPLAQLLQVDEDTVRGVLRGWGAGKFGAALLLDGKPEATLIPPAFGLAGVNLHTWTGWGGVSHWNALVANIEMGGSGTFYDPRLADASRFPVAARAGFDDLRREPDRITSKLPALHLYQLALRAPPAPPGSFDPDRARRGKQLFSGAAQCARCHVPPLYTEPGWNLHTAAEIGIDDLQAERSPDRRYRTSPLRGLWTHIEGGFYHDGRFATLADVVEHYDQTFGLGLTQEQRADLIEFLKSL